MPSIPTAPELHQEFFNIDRHEEGKATHPLLSTQARLSALYLPLSPLPVRKEEHRSRERQSLFIVNLRAAVTALLTYGMITIIMHSSLCQNNPAWKRRT
jgi:hypothetical protein